MAAFCQNSPFSTPTPHTAVNLFHYLSYEGAVDIDSIEDSVQKQATIGIINNFGQSKQTRQDFCATPLDLTSPFLLAPRQLFKKSHPKRNPLETTSNVPMITTSLNSADSSFESLVYRIHTHPSFMIQSAQPLKGREETSILRCNYYRRAYCLLYNSDPKPAD